MPQLVSFICNSLNFTLYCLELSPSSNDGVFMYPIWHLPLLKPTQRVRLLHHLTCTSSLTFSADTEWNTQHNCDTMIAHDLVITTGLLDNPFATRTDALSFFVHAIFAIPTTHHRGSTYTCCDAFLLVSFPLTSS